MFTSRLVFILFLLTATSAQADVVSIPADKEVIEFDTKLGKVIFAHEAHSGLRNVECRTCHHTYPDEDGLEDCHSCHKQEKGDAPKSKDAFHLRCRGCHKYTVESGSKAGPVKCMLCHQRNPEP